MLGDIDLLHPECRLASKDQPLVLPDNSRDIEAMQDKFSIGPVNIVQLVGLNAKPRIASAQADGAVRAADAVPPSAAAGLGDDLSQPLAETASSYLNVKAAPALNLSADPMGGHIALEGGVDRPIVDASASAPAIDPSASDLFLPNKNLPEPAVDARGETILPGKDALVIPDAIENKPVEVPAEISASGDVSGGVITFSNDQILDFTIKIDNAEFAQDAKSSTMSSSADDAIHSIDGMYGWGGFAIIDCAGNISPEPQLLNYEFVSPMHQLSATDAVPVI
jgi:hypothetical protein